MNCSIKLHLKWYILRIKQQECLFKNTHKQKKTKNNKQTKINKNIIRKNKNICFLLL
jgi:hypothetical protein